MIELAKGGKLSRENRYYNAIMGNTQNKLRNEWRTDCALAINNEDERQFILPENLDNDWTVQNLTALRQLKHGFVHVLDYDRFFIIYANGFYQIFSSEDTEPSVKTNHCLFALLIADYLAAA